MNCPVCNNVRLEMTDRQGVEIDYCPQCRGVWLDRGELDKIIERSTAGQHNSSAYPGNMTAYRDHHDYDHGDHGYRRKSFLEELFD